MKKLIYIFALISLITSLFTTFKEDSINITDFRDVMKDYPVRWDELFNQAFDNDKFKLLEALNNLNKNGVVEKYKIDMNQESVAAKKKILTDLLENLGKK